MQVLFINRKDYGLTSTLKEKGYGHKKPSGFKLREVNSPMKCWKTHKKVGVKKSPSGRTKNGKVVMVSDCVKK